MGRRFTGAMIIVFLIGLMGLTGCASSNTSSICTTGSKAQAQIPAPKKIGIMPVKVRICELDSGGEAEEVPQWSAEGKKIITESLLDYLKSTHKNVEIVQLKELSEENQLILDHYRALYERVFANKEFTKTIPAWNHKKRLRETLGEGMARFKDELGVDALLFIDGYDYHSSAGRQAAFLIVAVLSRGHNALSMGQCKLNAGLVDIKTGDLMWTGRKTSGSHSLKNRAHVHDIIQQSFVNFP